MGVETIGIITAISSIASALSGVAGAFGQKDPKAPKLPEAAAPPVPAGPPPDMMSFGGVRPGELMDAPNFLMQGSGGLNPQMTPQQQRAAIATRGVAGESSAYRDPATLDYYKNLALHSLTDPSGSVPEGIKPLPIEEQFVSQVLGEPPRAGSTESFLSALIRGTAA